MASRVEAVEKESREQGTRETADAATRSWVCCRSARRCRRAGRSRRIRCGTPRCPGAVRRSPRRRRRSPNRPKPGLPARRCLAKRLRELAGSIAEASGPAVRPTPPGWVGAMRRWRGCAAWSRSGGSTGPARKGPSRGQHRRTGAGRRRPGGGGRGAGETDRPTGRSGRAVAGRYASASPSMPRCDAWKHWCRPGWVSPASAPGSSG